MEGEKSLWSWEKDNVNDIWKHYLKNIWRWRKAFEFTHFDFSYHWRQRRVPKKPICRPLNTLLLYYKHCDYLYIPLWYNLSKPTTWHPVFLLFWNNQISFLVIRFEQWFFLLSQTAFPAITARSDGRYIPALQWTTPYVHRENAWSPQRQPIIKLAKGVWLLAAFFLGGAGRDLFDLPSLVPFHFRFSFSKLAAWNTSLAVKISVLPASHIPDTRHSPGFLPCSEKLM